MKYTFLAIAIGLLIGSWVSLAKNNPELTFYAVGGFVLAAVIAGLREVGQ